jgi:hypothetical protein
VFLHGGLSATSRAHKFKQPNSKSETLLLPRGHHVSLRPPFLRRSSPPQSTFESPHVVVGGKILTFHKTGLHMGPCYGLGNTSQVTLEGCLIDFDLNTGCGGNVTFASQISLTEMTYRTSTNSPLNWDLRIPRRLLLIDRSKAYTGLMSKCSTTHPWELVTTFLPKKSAYISPISFTDSSFLHP